MEIFRDKPRCTVKNEYAPGGIMLAPPAVHRTQFGNVGALAQRGVIGCLAALPARSRSLHSLARILRPR